MIFSSPLFLLVFLPIVISGHFLVPGRFRNIFLLVSSAVYYLLADISQALPVICLIAVNYRLGLMLSVQRKPDRGRLLLAGAVILNILFLVYFKYFTFIVENVNEVFAGLGLSSVTVQNVSAPLGLSFIIFQIVSYLKDSADEITEPQRNITNFALFVLFFSKVTAGPIIRHNEVAESLCSRTITLDDFTYGLKRFIVGLSKKVLIADVLAKTVNPVFALQQNELSTGAVWLVLLFYSLQLYFDFSGYSDMAIGIGRMLGFSFQENFDAPYRARSLTDFWRRWHISLSTWLRDYLFIPLNYALTRWWTLNKLVSGRIKPKHLTAASILFVFAVCGLWHGAAWTFVVWGALHGLVLAMESMGFSKTLKSWWRPLQHAYTLIVIMIAWVFFRSPTLEFATGYLKSMFLLTSGNVSLNRISPDAVTLEGVVTLGIAIMFVVLPVNDVVTALKSKYCEPIWHKELTTGSLVVGGISLACYLCLLILSLAAISATTYNPFLYGKF